MYVSGLHAIPESYTSLVGVECIAIMVHSVIPMIPVPAGSSAAFSQADLKSSRDTKKSAKIAMKQLLWAPNTKKEILVIYFPEVDLRNLYKTITSLMFGKNYRKPYNLHHILMFLPQLTYICLPLKYGRFLDSCSPKMFPPG
jgi:hypothetical protein